MNEIEKLHWLEVWRHRKKHTDRWKQPAKLDRGPASFAHIDVCRCEDMSMVLLRIEHPITSIGKLTAVFSLIRCKLLRIENIRAINGRSNIGGESNTIQIYVLDPCGAAGTESNHGGMDTWWYTRWSVEARSTTLSYGRPLWRKTIRYDFCEILVCTWTFAGRQPWDVQRVEWRPSWQRRFIHTI